MDMPTWPPGDFEYKIELNDVFDVIKREMPFGDYLSEEDVRQTCLPSTSMVQFASEGGSSSDGTDLTEDFGASAIFSPLLDEELVEDAGPSKPSHSSDSAPRQCVVCLESTKCYHYDVPACTGCKTFFRRCLVTDRRYVCQFGGNCDITRGDDCRGCRFERCLVSGMNASAIQYPKNVDAAKIVDRVKQMKRKLVEENKPIIAKMLPTFSQSKEVRDIDFLLYLEAKQRRLRDSEYNPKILFDETIRSLLQRGSELNLADKYNKPSNWPMSMGTLYKIILEKKEAEKKQEQRTWKFQPAVDLILTVEMAKILPVFAELCLDDKEVLLRHVTVVNMLLTQSYYSYQQNLDTIVHPNGFIPVKMDQLSGRGLLPLKCDTYARAVQSITRARLLPEHYVLLKAIVYCHPAVEGLSQNGRDTIVKYHDRYGQALLRYLQMEMGSCQGATKYGSIIGLIETFWHLAEKYKQVHLLHLMRLKDRNCQSAIIDFTLINQFLK